MLNATPTPITPPRVPLIDQRTGLIERSWYMFFLSLFRTSQDDTDPQMAPDTNSLLASYDAALLALAQEIQTTHLQIDVQAELLALRQELQTQPITMSSISGITAVNYSYTGAITGMDAALAATVTYTRIGDVVTMDIPSAFGTSNAATMTLTGGTDAMKPATTKTVICGVGNSGSVVIGIINIETDGTLTFLRGLEGVTFSTSGLKGIERGSFSYTVV